MMVAEVTVQNGLSSRTIHSEEAMVISGCLVEEHRDHRDYTRQDVSRAIREVVASFPVYRTYVVPSRDEITDDEAVSTKVAIISTTIQLLDAAADLYSGKAAFFETFEPAKNILAHLVSKPCRTKLPATLVERFTKLQSKLDKMLSLAQVARRPLELHHHRPLPIKMAIPKFEDSFDPGLSTMPALTFGVGYGEHGDSRVERGLGMSRERVRRVLRWSDLLRFARSIAMRSAFGSLAFCT